MRLLYSLYSAESTCVRIGLLWDGCERTAGGGRMEGDEMSGISKDERDL